MERLPKAICLAGNSGSGKDSFFHCLQWWFSKKLPNRWVERVSLGDICRAECDDYCREQFGISAFTNSRKKKDLIRPIIVETVKIKKKLNPNYYIDQVKARIKELQESDVIPCMTDGRYLEEVQFFKKIGGILVYIERFDIYGVKVPPANEEEEFFNKILKKKADYRVDWGTLTSRQRKGFTAELFEKWFE